MGGRSIGDVFSCSDALADAGSASWIARMQCVWQSPTSLRATLPLRTDASASVPTAVTPDASTAFVSAVAGAICPVDGCLAGAFCVDPAAASVITATPTSVEPPPTITLAAPAIVGSCDAVPLSALLSSTPRAITWSVTTTFGDGAPLLAAELQSLSSAYSLPTPAPLLSASLFPAGAADYTFIATATDYRGVDSTAATVVVKRSASPVPSVQISLPSVIRVESATRVAAVVAPEACVDEAAGARTLSYSWYFLDGESLEMSSLASVPTVLLPAYSLPPGVPSKLLLTVTATSPGASSPLSTTVEASITPPLQPLVATIAGGSERSAGLADALVLDASACTDPSFPTLTLEYAWSCVGATALAAAADSASATTATAASSPDISDACALLAAAMTPTATQSILSLPAGSLPYADVVYAFQLEISPNNAAKRPGSERTGAIATVNVQVMDESLPQVAIEVMLVSGSTLPATSEPLRLQGSAIAAAIASTSSSDSDAESDADARATAPMWTYLWSLSQQSSGVAVALPAEIASSRDLVLPPTATYQVGSLTSVGLPAGTYTARLEAYDSSVAGANTRRLQSTSVPVLIGFASTLVEINAPPFGGSVAASPASGVAGSTRFTLTAAGFTDEPTRYPITYVFWSEPLASASTAQRVALAPASEQTVLRNVVLPRGELRIGCTATDAFGASADAAYATHVSVSAPTLSVDELLSSALNAASGEGSASLSAQILGTSAQALVAGGAAGTAEEREQQQQQAASLISAVGTTWALAAGDSALLGSLATLLDDVSGTLDSSSESGQGAASETLQLVETFLDPSSISALPPAARNSTLGSLGGALSGVLGAAASPESRRRALEADASANGTSSSSTASEAEAVGSARFREQVAGKISKSVDLLTVGALSGSLSGEGFALDKPNIALLASRQETASLAGRSLSASTSGATFVLPAEAVEAAKARGQAAAESVDVQVVSYPSGNPYAYHPSAARTAGVASSLTLRSGDGTELPVSGLAAPIRVAIPLAIALDGDDFNPYFGARCGEGSADLKDGCDVELKVRAAGRAEHAHLSLSLSFDARARVPLHCVPLHACAFARNAALRAFALNAAHDASLLIHRRSTRRATPRRRSALPLRGRRPSYSARMSLSTAHAASALSTTSSTPPRRGAKSWRSRRARATESATLTARASVSSPTGARRAATL